MKFLGSIAIMLLLVSCKQEPNSGTASVSGIADDARPVADSVKIRNKAEEALQFCKKKNFSTDFCLLIDMSLHSGVKRFFVWDFRKNKMTGKYLVGHGCGTHPWSKDGSKDRPEFSNEDGSHLSSLGKYKVQERGSSEWAST